MASVSSDTGRSASRAARRIVSSWAWVFCPSVIRVAIHRLVFHHGTGAHRNSCRALQHQGRDAEADQLDQHQDYAEEL
jgi:hypothetical protein